MDLGAFYSVLVDSLDSNLWLHGEKLPLVVEVFGDEKISPATPMAAR